MVASRLVVKDTPAEELASVVRTVYDGGNLIDPDLVAIAGRYNWHHAACLARRIVAQDRGRFGASFAWIMEL